MLIDYWWGLDDVCYALFSCTAANLDQPAALIILKNQVWWDNLGFTSFVVCDVFNNWFCIYSKFPCYTTTKSNKCNSFIEYFTWSLWQFFNFSWGKCCLSRSDMCSHVLYNAQSIFRHSRLLQTMDWVYQYQNLDCLLWCRLLYFHNDLVNLHAR